MVAGPSENALINPKLAPVQAEARLVKAQGEQRSRSMACGYRLAPEPDCRYDAGRDQQCAVLTLYALAEKRNAAGSHFDQETQAEAWSLSGGSNSDWVDCDLLRGGESIRDTLCSRPVTDTGFARTSKLKPLALAFSKNPT